MFVVLDLNVHIAIVQIIGARKGRDRAGCDHSQERCRREDTEHRPVGLAVLCLHKKYPLFLLIPKFLFSKEALRLTTATCKKSLSDTDYNLQKTKIKTVVGQENVFDAKNGRIRHSAQEIAAEFGGI